MITATVHFPSEQNVIDDVDIVKSVAHIKKMAFMNAVNTNMIAKDMRPEMIPAKM